MSRRRRLAVRLTVEDLAVPAVAASAVAVIDVLRATSTLSQAFAAGAMEAVPVPTPEAARRLGSGTGDVLLCGERQRMPIPGFDLGNSPLEFTPERVAGKRLVVVTTNGTRTLLAAAPAPLAVVAAFVNARSAVKRLLDADRDVLLACSGNAGRPAPEDTLLAGCLVARLLEADPQAEPAGEAPAALALWERAAGDVAGFLEATEAGRVLTRLGLEGDVAFCASLDRLETVPELRPGTPTVTPGRPN